ncbi:MAG: site-specific integrase [Sphaerochaetaceae bacterium]
MDRDERTFGMLASNLLGYLARLKYQTKTIEGYRYRLIHLSKMLPEGDSTIYDHEAWATIVRVLEENKTWPIVESFKHTMLHTANAVFELHNTGSIEIHHKASSEAKLAEGIVLPEILLYINDLKRKGYVDHTIYEHQTHILKFQEYIAYRNLGIMDIDTGLVLGFIASLAGYSNPIRYRVICCLRVFLRFVHSEGYVGTDFSIFIPKLRINTTEQLPSIYSGDEVREILSSIDTGSPVGKRDYAIILLIAKTGLRAGDISNMEFSNIRWDDNTIIITQQKTGRKLLLPLLDDVGNAVINYIRHGRPESQSSRIFLQGRPRFEPLSAPAVSSIFQNMAYRGGVLAKPGRKHGSHAFRHSIVSEMLSKAVPFPIITQVLGHSSVNTTMAYARIDLQSLSNCPLDVPPIPSGRFQNTHQREGGSK